LISLGDIVTVYLGDNKTAKARVVMLGDTYEHLNLDALYVDWLRRDRVLEPSAIVIEWLDRNPYALHAKGATQVDNFLITEPDEDIVASPG
jgi:hypothetical protein